MGISVDSVYAHAAFGAAVGGIRFPLLADFNPKGHVGRLFGRYLEGHGIDDRATVIIDADGIIRHNSSVSPSGRRDMNELLAAVREIDDAYQGDLPTMREPDGLPCPHTLYVRDRCMFSRWAMYTRDNLHLGSELPVRNVSQDEDAKVALTDKGGKAQAPALDVGDKVLYESQDIAAYLAGCAALE